MRVTAILDGGMHLGVPAIMGARAPDELVVGNHLGQQPAGRLYRMRQSG